jgi:hypothetical protein
MGKTKQEIRKSVRATQKDEVKCKKIIGLEKSCKLGHLQDKDRYKRIIEIDK